MLPLPFLRPSMKPSIAPPVLFDETINRGSGPTPSSLLLPVSLSYHLSYADSDSSVLLLHVSLATNVHLA